MSGYRRLVLPALLIGATGGFAGTCGSARVQRAARKAPPGRVLTGQAALGDWTTDAPGVRRRITTADLPPPYATRSVDNGPRVVARPQGAWPRVPPGFKVQ